MARASSAGLGFNYRPSFETSMSVVGLLNKATCSKASCQPIMLLSGVTGLFTDMHGTEPQTGTDSYVMTASCYPYTAMCCECVDGIVITSPGTYAHDHCRMPYWMPMAVAGAKTQLTFFLLIGTLPILNLCL